MPDPLTQPWFAVPDDTIGGWACATADVPVSQIDTRRRDVAIVAHFLGEATARRIAGLHNADLGLTRLLAVVPDQPLEHFIDEYDKTVIDLHATTEETS